MRGGALEAEEGVQAADGGAGPVEGESVQVPEAHFQLEGGVQGQDGGTLQEGQKRYVMPNIIYSSTMQLSFLL